MKIAIAGASGMIGTALTEYLKGRGDVVVALKRNPDSKTQPFLGVDPDYLMEFDAVINLAGENIAAKRWSDEQKKLILDSRVETTEFLARTLAKTKGKPQVFISGSAIGYYGNRDNEVIDENSSVGLGFLADVCKAWEGAADHACRDGLRIVKLRTGVVLGKSGGALAKMLLPFQMGAGGILGSGRQYMSWISLADAVRVIDFIIKSSDISGPVNMTAPHPVTNSEFTAAMGRVLHRPAVLPAPAFALKVILGQMAEEMLLEGANVMPRKLEKAGFKFDYGNLNAALAAEISGEAASKHLQTV